MTRSEFEHIAAQLRQRVLKVGLDFFGSRDDAEDAAQEAMIQLWRYCEHIDAERNIEALAVRVAKNCCVSMYRKQQHVADPSKEPLSDRTIDRHQTATPHDPQVQLEAQETRRMLTDSSGFAGKTTAMKKNRCMSLLRQELLRATYSLN